jgi:hypothetical protein
MKITRFVYLLVAVLLINSCTQDLSYNSEITQDELYAHIDYLASDSLQGRSPGTPFDRVAAKYIKDQYEGMNLMLLGKNGYQFFSFITHQEAGPRNFLSLKLKSLEFGKDFTVFPFSSSDTISASVVFVGFGFKISNDSLVWNDYKNVNLTGKWALILRGDPDYSKPSSIFASFSDDRHKAMVAKDNGATGVILVSGVEFDAEDNLIDLKQKYFDIGIPVVQLKREAIDLVLKPNGHTVSELEKKVLETRKSIVFDIPQTISARTDIINRTKNSQNVVGTIEGSDPVLKNQYIVIGAHYDHLGLGGPGTSSRMPDTMAVHNGADDNASGVAAMIEVGQKLASKRPKRSVILVAFGAEELGLLGSRNFTENPIIPVDSISAMINIDMLGRMDNDKVQVGGVKTSPDFVSILNQFGEAFNLNLSLSDQGYGPSDHASFYSKNVPVLFFSTGPHIDYHTPNDVIERINFDGMVKGAKYIYEVTNELANQSEKLVFQEAGPKSQPSRHGRELKVRLGIMPDVSSTQTNGLAVLAVTENQPAWFAGMKKGDVITSINGKKIGNIQDYMFRLGELKPGMTINVEVLRNNEKLVLLVQL